MQQARGWLLLLLAVLGSAAGALAQTVTIGSTTIPVATPATSSYFYGPIYRSSAASAFNYSRYAHLYTAAELGIPNGVTITQLEWLKADGGTVTGANTLNVLLNNSTATTLTDGTTWGALTTGATSVYTNAAQDVTGAAGTYFTVPTTGFIYTGGSLLVLNDWMKGGTATAAVNFITNPATGLALGAANSTALTSTTALTVANYGDRRPTLRITYIPTLPCTAPPTAGTATASATNVCAGTSVSLALSGSATGSGLTVQWQSSATGVAGSYTNIAGATSNSYTTPALGQTTYYRAVVTCSGQAANSTAVQVTVLAPTYATLPYTQGFENTWLSRCNTNEAPDANWLNTPATGNNSWRRDDDGASANWTSPTAGAYTPTGSQGSSHSARFHSYFASNGTIGTLDLYANLSATGSKRLTFDYVNVSTGGSKLDVLVSTDGGATFSTTPLLTVTTAAAFTAQTVDLTAVAATAVIRFQATSDFGSYDIGVDNVQVRALPPVDLAAAGLATPTATQGCYGSAETVAVTVSNQGGAALNFATNPATVTAVVTTPGGSQTLTGSITTGTLAAGATRSVTLAPTLNMTTFGTYTFALTATVTGDGNTANDLLVPSPTRTVAAPVAGTLASASGNVCVSGTATLTLTGAANGTIQYQSSTSATGTFTDIAGATSAAYTTPVLTTTTYYRAQVRCNTGTATSNVFTVTVNNPLVATTNTPLSICGGSTATLTATASAGSSVRFFSAATGGTALATTTAGSYTTPALTASTTYYAEAYTPNGSTETGGRTAPTVTAGFLATDTGLIFTTTTGLTIQSAVIYPVGTGTITFAVRNSAGTELAVTPAISVTGSGATTPVLVPLNLQVPSAGTDYTLVVKAFTGLTDLLRENPLPTGFSFPSTSPSGAFSITNGINVSPLAAYYYFYSIVLSTDCVGATRTAVQVNVTQPASGAFSYPATGSKCAGSTGTVAPTLAAGATAGTFTSTTGLTIGATTGVVNLATSTAGTYTVTNTLPASGVCGVQTATATITINPTPARPTLAAGYNGTVTTLTSSSATGNQFYYNGTAIAGATGQSYVVNGSATTYGSYTVVVTNTFGCSSQASVASVVTTARAGIAGASVQLFPNPTPDGRVTLELSGFRSATQLAVLDALGRVVRAETLPATTGVVVHSLDLSRLASGVYVLRLTNNDGIETRRLTRD